MNIQHRSQDDQLIEARLAARITGSLQHHANELPHDVTERLRFAREQALIRARSVRMLSPAGAVVAAVSGRGAASLAGFVPWWQRAASAIPVAMLLLGLMAIDHWTVREQVVAAADFDTQLLADDLPPAAYSDPGFAEFIRSTPTP
jgi:anti-sigma factor RsiW